MASARSASPKATTTASKTPKTKAPTMPSTEEIRRRAYEIWRSRGGAGGNPDEDWAQAERELRLELTPPSW